MAIDEARAVGGDTVIQACTTAASAKECVELTQHAQSYGADICYLQTPPMEVHGGEGVLRFFQYVADRSDIALGYVQLGLVRLRAQPAGGRPDLRQVPAVCAR